MCAVHFIASFRSASPSCGVLKVPSALPPCLPSRSRNLLPCSGSRRGHGEAADERRGRPPQVRAERAERPLHAPGAAAGLGLGLGLLQRRRTGRARARPARRPGQRPGQRQHRDHGRAGPLSRVPGAAPPARERGLERGLQQAGLGPRLGPWLGPRLRLGQAVRVAAGVLRLLLVPGQPAWQPGRAPAPAVQQHQPRVNPHG